MPQVRWVCPNCGKGALGSTRPRKDDAVRFCLKCTGTTGKLVLRSAPTLEARRTETLVRRQAKQQTMRADAREQRIVMVREVSGEQTPLHVDETLAKMLRLPEIQVERTALKKQGWLCPHPKITLRQSRIKPYTSGRAWTGGDMIITIAANPSREEVEYVLLHELVHCVTANTVHHGPRYRAAMVRACMEWWPGLKVKNQGDLWYVGQAIIKDAQRLKGMNE